MGKLPLLLLSMLSASGIAPGADYAELPGGAFRSAIRYEENAGNLTVAPFLMMKAPVSNRQFLSFVERNPQWRRDQAPALLAGGGYLSHWHAGDDPGAAADEAVVQVSWYAAAAYCKEQGARLPTWTEWEYAAAADGSRLDARHDAAWRARWLHDGTANAMDAGAQPGANAHGVSGLHGRNWEWTDDYASLLGAPDRRSGDDGDRLKFCGATALSFNDRENYAVLKRIALLSALQPANTLGNLGFRCARSSQ
ncbi:formylglycine-generating enzyme family protein [Pseudoxanthomonas wuyuanensis]|uniref:Formylglycine-generating enzyme, required for sulfatase activity, contains SUMF1/FGE domain n=1 Tax=Pseudoxanthomonas wuyuanensis TaxID=1073196 RepID=A0A286CZ64_9GAMM|nr:formylglycine-generating enzyme family protein [Pseudoxanthomonas wuyuanensis]KAF1722295.1 formylglycine-generating enzyme family protein [Pseudoxanthomonas wuyuanensis]SOD51688.1 Formylglycine-generating enzyme, required for sulfatase activity, contains SUMF1/FGE domain [Pseudoxanthomonas wuyuanensis]